jgi:hypothetical protein
VRNFTTDENVEFMLTDGSDVARPKLNSEAGKINLKEVKRKFRK